MSGSRIEINPRALDAVKDILRAAFRGEVAAMADVARERCPVKTGELRDSIQVTVEQSDAAGEIDRLEATSPHAAPVEFGSGRFPAEPFLRPALAGFSLGRVSDRASRAGLRVRISQATALVGGEFGAAAGGELGEILGIAAGESLGGPAGGYFGAAAGRRIGSHYGRRYGSRAGGNVGGVIHDRTSAEVRRIAADIMSAGKL